MGALTAVAALQILFYDCIQAFRIPIEECFLKTKEVLFSLQEWEVPVTNWLFEYKLEIF